MRRIERTGQFRRDYKREAKGPHRVTLESDFIEILKALVNDRPLAEKHRDHVLTGDWNCAPVRGFFDRSVFRERFKAKGHFKSYLAAIPTYVIIASNIALRGVAAAFEK